MELNNEYGFIIYFRNIFAGRQWTPLLLGQQWTLSKYISASQFEHSTLLELLRWRAEQQPEQRIYSFLADGETEKEFFTFSQLDLQARSIGALLQQYAASGERALLIYPSGLDFIAEFFGCLYSGIIAVPVYPPSATRADRTLTRVRAIAADARPALILTTSALSSRIDGIVAQSPELQGIRIISTSDLPSDLGQQWHEPAIRSESLAFLQYTSGSTGEPKGVAAEHRGMVNRIVAQAGISAFGEEDVCCQKTSIGFVDAIFETLGALSYGRPLVLACEEEATDVQKLAALIQRAAVTRLVTVPSVAQAMLESPEAVRSLQGLRVWTLSGEELPGGLLRKLQDRLADCTFINLYGSSEVAADATWYVCRRSEGARVPIGRPIPNMAVYILDPHQQPVPIGVVGEIHVGGVGLARGYLNRPQLTAECFIADPFSADPTARLYRSGDWGRWRADGTIEYLGRGDRQVKIRGFRIELGEIEAQLMRHPQVRQAAVIAHEEPSWNEKSLVAYVVGQQSELQQQLVPMLREYLKGWLPEHMIPSCWTLMEGLPLTPNGKVDRHKLPAPQARPEEPGENASPRTDLERRLAEIWARVFRVNHVSIHDSFLEFGGRSLLAIRLVEEISRHLAVRPSVSALYQHPTIRELSLHLQSLLAQK